MERRPQRYHPACLARHGIPRAFRSIHSRAAHAGARRCATSRRSCARSHKRRRCTAPAVRPPVLRVLGSTGASGRPRPGYYGSTGVHEQTQAHGTGEYRNRRAGPPTYCSRQRERGMAQARLMTPHNDDVVGAADFAQPASSPVEEALAQVRPRGRQLSQQSW